MTHTRKRSFGFFAAASVFFVISVGPVISETPVSDLSSGHRNLAFVAHASDPVVSVIDMDTKEVADSLVFQDLGGKEQGHFLSVSPDGRHLWIAEGIAPDSGNVQVVDLSTRQQVRRWEVGAGVGNHMTRDGKYVFTSSTKTNRINVFDAVNLRYLGDFPLGAAPHVIESSPDGRILWTTDAGGNLVAFDISGLPDRMPTLADRIVIGGRLHALAVHPNGRYVFVGSDQSGDNVVDVASRTIVAKIPGKPHNYEISPDGKYLLAGEIEFSAGCDEPKDLGRVSATKGPMLRFVNIAALSAERRDLATVKTEKWLEAGGLTPSSISHHMYEPDGDYLLISLYLHQGVSPKREGALVFVDASTLEIKRVLHLPPRPHSIAVAGHQR